VVDEQEKKVCLFNPVELLQEQINDSNTTGFIKKFELVQFMCQSIT